MFTEVTIQLYGLRDHIHAVINNNLTIQGIILHFNRKLKKASRCKINRNNLIYFNFLKILIYLNLIFRRNVADGA